jgi:hypothetical protein
MDRGKLYQQMFESYKKFLVNKSTREAQDEAVKTWNALKAECTEKVVFEQRIKNKIIELETAAKKKTASLMTFWCSVPVKKDAADMNMALNTTSNSTDPESGILNFRMSQPVAC